MTDRWADYLDPDADPSELDDTLRGLLDLTKEVLADESSWDTPPASLRATILDNAARISPLMDPDALDHDDGDDDDDDDGDADNGDDDHGGHTPFDAEDDIDGRLDHHHDDDADGADDHPGDARHPHERVDDHHDDAGDHVSDGGFGTGDITAPAEHDPDLDLDDGLLLDPDAETPIDDVGGHVVDPTDDLIDDTDHGLHPDHVPGLDDHHPADLGDDDLDM